MSNTAPDNFTGYEDRKNINGVLAGDEDGTISRNAKAYRIRDGLVPICVTISKFSVKLAKFKDATHVLVDKIGRWHAEGECNYTLFGTLVSAYILCGVDADYVYYQVDQPIFTHNKATISAISKHFSTHYDAYYYNAPCDPAPLFDLGLPTSSIVHHTPFTLSALPFDKITSEHHIHFSAAEAYVSTDPETRHRLSELWHIYPGVTSTMMAGLILWVTSISDAHFALVKASHLLHSASLRDYKQAAKLLSTRAKSCQNLVALDLRQVFELDVLVNRVDGVVDWYDEKANRVNADVTLLSDSDVYAAARRIMQQASLIGREPVNMSWQQYWGSRWQWSAAGSTHSQYVEDDIYKSKIRELKNKFITISTMPEFEFGHFAGRKPEIQAWASTKYEWGKLRAIYGTDLTSYILSNFAFYNCENVLPNQFPVGKDATPKNVSSRVAAVMDGNLPFCLDFQDFNSQHSEGSMKAVIMAYKDVFGDKMSQAQREAIDWTMLSLDNTIVNDNVGTHSRYRAKGTLLSGWRLTTFMNSVLNKVYTDKLVERTTKVYNSLHNGDDVIIGTRNLALPQRCLSNAGRYNIRMQPSKCAFGGIAEFLRVDHVRGEHGQYMSRSIATLVHSRIESKISVDARDLIESMESRLSDCYARGMSIETVSMLREVYYRRQSVITEVPVEDMYKIKLAHRVMGGIDSSITGEIEYLVVPGKRDTKGVDIDVLPGVVSYAKQVKAKLELEVGLGEVIKRIMRATYEAVIVKNRKVSVVKHNNEERYDIWRALYKAHSADGLTPAFGKAMLTGFALEVLTMQAPGAALTRFLQSAKSPLTMLGIVL